MRLYFHILNGTEMIRDEKGVEVADLDAAKAVALNTSGRCGASWIQSRTIQLSGSWRLLTSLVLFCLRSTCAPPTAKALNTILEIRSEQTERHD